MTPEEVEAAIEAFQLLEPVVQKGIADLIGKLKGKKQLTALDYINEAQALILKETATPPTSPT